MIGNLSEKVLELRTEIAWNKKLLNGLNWAEDQKEILDIQKHIKHLIEEHDQAAAQIKTLLEVA